jgi:protein-ribulosamine 3-kinase
MDLEPEYSASKLPIGPTQKQTEQTSSKSLPMPSTGGTYELDQNVITGMSTNSHDQTLQLTLTPAFPIPGTEIVQALEYGTSLWGKTAKVSVRLPSGEMQHYFLKV